jgi:hypothetical protein
MPRHACGRCFLSCLAFVRLHLHAKLLAHELQVEQRGKDCVMWRLHHCQAVD